MVKFRPYLDENHDPEKSPSLYFETQEDLTTSIGIVMGYHPNDTAEIKVYLLIKTKYPFYEYIRIYDNTDNEIALEDIYKFKKDIKKSVEKFISENPSKEIVGFDADFENDYTVYLWNKGKLHLILKDRDPNSIYIEDILPVDIDRNWYFNFLKYQFCKFKDFLESLFW